MSHKSTRTDRGFTIIELLIATMVFSLILIVITAGVLRFTRQYYKGVISNQTQNTTRAIIDDVARAVQFNSGSVQKLTSNSMPAPPLSTYGYCIGDSKRYSFVLNRQVTSSSPSALEHQSKYGLVSDNTTGCTTSTLALRTDITSGNLVDPGTNVRELLGEHMRLNKFSIASTGLPSDGVYTIVVKVIYGDDELLCSPNVAGECDPGTTTLSADRSDLTCRSSSGAQFCAVSELTTTVKKRVN